MLLSEKAAAFLARQQRALLQPWNWCILQASRPRQLRAACKSPRAASSPARCAVAISKTVRPAMAEHLEPLSVFCGGTLRAVRCHSGRQGAAAGCAAQSHARARAGAQERAAQAPATVGSSLPPCAAALSGVWAARHRGRRAGCRAGPHSPWSWDGVSGALLAAAAFLCAISCMPCRRAGMQRHARCLRMQPV